MIQLIKCWKVVKLSILTFVVVVGLICFFFLSGPPFMQMFSGMLLNGLFGTSLNCTYKNVVVYSLLLPVCTCRGCYMAQQRYEFYFQVQWLSKILFLQQKSETCENLKNVWNIYCVITNLTNKIFNHRNHRMQMHSSGHKTYLRNTLCLYILLRVKIIAVFYIKNDIHYLVWEILENKNPASA